MASMKNDSQCTKGCVGKGWRKRVQQLIPIVPDAGTCGLTKMLGLRLVQRQEKLDWAEQRWEAG